MRDRLEQTTERVSVASGGEQADDGSFGASVSGDGNFVVFASLAGNLVPGSPPGVNVYRRNRLTGTVELLSAARAKATQHVARRERERAHRGLRLDASLVLNDSLPVDVFVRATGAGADLNDDDDDLDIDLPELRDGSRAGAPAGRARRREHGDDRLRPCARERPGSGAGER